MIEEKRIIIPSIKIGDIEVEDIEVDVLTDFEPSWESYFDCSSGVVNRVEAEIIDFYCDTELTDEQQSELQEKINECVEDLC